METIRVKNKAALQKFRDGGKASYTQPERIILYEPRFIQEISIKCVQL
jgi:hypothetical protein